MRTISRIREANSGVSPNRRGEAIAWTSAARVRLGHHTEHGRLEQPRGDRYHPDAARRQIPRGRQGQADDACLGGRVCGLAHLSLKGGDRGRIDNDPAFHRCRACRAGFLLLTLGRIASCHGDRGEPQHVERAHEVDVEDPAEEREVMRPAVLVHDPGAPADAGAVDQHPQRPECCRLGHSLLRFGLAGDVGRNERAHASVREFLPRLLVGVDQHELRTGRMEAGGGRPAQPGRGAGDQRDRPTRAADAHDCLWLTRARRCRGPARAAGTYGCRARWAASFPGPECAVSHSIHCGHHDPWCSVAPASHWSGSSLAGGPSQ